MNLREYQKEPVNKGIEFFKQKSPKPSIIVAPTAAGKSLYVSSIANNIEGKTLVFQPSKELLEQNLEKLKILGGEASVYSASMGVKEFGDKITYATIGSIKNLGAEFKERGYSNLIIDEIHLYPRGEYSMLGKFLKESEIIKVLGLTATAFKLQTNSFNMVAFSKLQMLTSRSKNGSFFKEILHVTQIQDIIKLGYWSKLEYELDNFDTSNLKYNSTKAEYTEESIEKAYEENNIQDKIIERLKNTDRKSILVFVPTVAEAVQLSNKVDNSTHISALTPKKEREEIIRKFKNKEIKCIFNVGILGTGFDYPEIDCIISGRTTASLALWYQQVGRGTRIHPDKKDCLIVDFAGNTKRFGKIEHLVYKKDGKIWKLYGEGGKLLTGIPIDSIGEITEESENKQKEAKQVIKNNIKSEKKVMPFGKFQNVEIKMLPEWYKNWLLTKFEFNSKTEFIKKELLSV